MGIIVALVPLLFIADQMVKWWVLERIFANRLLGMNGLDFWAWFSANKLAFVPSISIPVFPSFNLSMAWNRGISFSLFSSQSMTMPYILSAFSVAVCVGFLIWAARSTARLEHIGIGLIVGGALGNAFDRIRFGAVADFFDFYVGNWHFPAFNVADAAITVGVCVILFYAFLHKQKG